MSSSAGVSSSRYHPTAKPGPGRRGPPLTEVQPPASANLALLQIPAQSPIYNGRRVGLGWASVLAVVLIRYGEIAIYLTGLVTGKWLFLMARLVVMQFSLAADAYQEAKSINAMQKNSLTARCEGTAAEGVHPEKH